MQRLHLLLFGFFAVAIAIAVFAVFSKANSSSADPSMHSSSKPRRSTGGRQIIIPDYQLPLYQFAPTSEQFLSIFPEDIIVNIHEAKTLPAGPITIRARIGGHKSPIGMHHTQFMVIDESLVTENAKSKTPWAYDHHDHMTLLKARGSVSFVRNNGKTHNLSLRERSSLRPGQRILVHGRKQDTVPEALVIFADYVCILEESASDSPEQKSSK